MRNWLESPFRRSVSNRPGHSSVILTLDTYSHIIRALQELATEKLEEAFFWDSSTNIPTACPFSRKLLIWEVV